MIFKIYSNPNHVSFFDKVPLKVHFLRDRRSRKNKKEIKKWMEPGKKNSIPTSLTELRIKKGLSRNINESRGAVSL